MARTRSTAARGLSVLVLMALVMVAAPPVPAAADHAPEGAVALGSGALEGTESNKWQSESFTGVACFYTRRSLFRLRGAGSYHGETAEGQEVVYRAQGVEGEPLYRSGPLQVELENTEPYYHGPGGTHGSDPCGGEAGQPIAASFSIFAAEGAEDLDDDGRVDVLTGAAWVYRVDDSGAKVPCRGQGSFVREGPSWRAEWALTDDCVVVGNAAGTPGSGVARAATTHTHHGKHAGCGGTCFDNLKTDYVQYAPVEGPQLTMAGPSSAQVADLVTVTARVVEDGLPVTGHPVEFAVSGPTLAVPPAGVATTGADGRAAFTFTAAEEGEYTVTASVTRDGQSASATHTVSIGAKAARMTLTGPSRSQTEEDMTFTATLSYAGQPAEAMEVDFAVAGPGQATPPAGSATTDRFGRARFTFRADRAGDYTVTASADHPLGGRASAERSVHLDINTFYRDGTLTSPSGEGYFESAVMDPAGRYAYFGASTGRRVVKYDLATFERIGTSPTLSSQPISAAIISPDGRYGYFALINDNLVKVDLATLQPVAETTVGRVETAIIDPAGDYAYLSINQDPNARGRFPARVVKIDANTLQQVDEFTFPAGENTALSAVMDPEGDHAYFGATGDEFNPDGARVVKVDLRTFERVGALPVPEARHSVSGNYGQDSLTAAVIDADGRYAYFATPGLPGTMVKINLTTFKKVAALGLSADNVQSAVIDPAGDYAYFATGLVANPNRPAVIDKVDLRTFERVHAIAAGDALRSAVIEPGRDFAYFGTGTSPGKVLRVALSRPPKAALAARDDAYATGYRTALSVPAPGVLGNDTDTEDGDPLTAHLRERPEGGEVDLEPDGSFTYTPDDGFTGTDTFTYVASDAMDYSAPATVTVEVSHPTEPQGLAFNYYTDIALMSGPPEKRGYGQAPDAPAEAESPAVACPEGGGTASDAKAEGARAAYGPAVIFGGIWPDDNKAAPPSGPMTADIDCELGADGHVSASTSLTLSPGATRDADGNWVEPTPTWQTSGGTSELWPGGAGPGPVIADEVHSSCTMTPDGTATSDVTVINGILETKYDADTGEPVETEPVPENPPPNYTREGTLDHVGDSYRVVYNQQTEHPDGSFTVNAVHMYLLGPSAVGDMVIGSSTCGPLPVVDQPATGGAVTDFDGDGATDIGVFRPGTGRWHIRGVDGLGSVGYGLQGDIPVPGDYSGDGTTDMAVFRPDAGRWYVRGVEGLGSVNYGMDGDIPVPGDYDGDGTTDMAVFRPSNGRWYVRGVEGLESVGFGVEGDIPVPGDYDGDGKTDIAVFRPDNGRWYLRGVEGLSSVGYGLGGDIPVPGDYDGDATTDIAVFRPDTGRWHVRGVDGLGSVGYGTTGDIPVVMAPALHRLFFPPAPG